ncbi:c-type cytochrome [Melaminivora sp.]|uniref:c-type cytochrome n=1 Tax=Melaminivora sp. TaxID=1933032 RepID=UPI0028B23E43|nr:c-type cytochrome [Melaminivora sp.]
MGTSGSPGAAGGTTGASSTGAAASGAAAGGAATASADAGKGVYDKTCFACHGAGIAGAPKLGDKADWGPRIAQGKDTLYKHAIQGYTGSKGVMPPKGGATNLSDDEVKSAVNYMVGQAG